MDINNPFGIVDQCMVYVFNKVYLGFDQILNGTLTKVPLDKNITPYHRQFLEQMIKAKESSVTLFDADSNLMASAKAQLQGYRLL